MMVTHQNFKTNKKIHDLIVLFSMVSRQIQWAWRKSMKRIAPSGPKGDLAIHRDKRRLQIGLYFRSICINEMMEDRAHNTIKLFLLDKFRLINLSISLRRCAILVTGIQTKIRNYHNSTAAR